MRRVIHKFRMPVAPAQSRQKVSSQAAFATSKLIQNLGQNSEQYKFEGNLRNAWGRD